MARTRSKEPTRRHPLEPTIGIRIRPIHTIKLKLMWSASSLFPFHQQRARQILALVRPQREPDIHIIKKLVFWRTILGKTITCARDAAVVSGAA